jgi:nicotinamide phosphoribosyltransferase
MASTTPTADAGEYAMATPFSPGNGRGMENILLLTDSYKVSHHVQYPKGVTTIYSYFESRGGRHREVCFFGLQYFIKRYLTGAIVTQAKIDEASVMYKMHFGAFATNVFNKEGWEYVLNKHGGVLPVTIKAVPEGTVLPYKNCCMTVENTDPKCFWLVNFLETLLVQVWYPMTVATNSREQKKVILKYLSETDDGKPDDDVLFKLHDFGFRGVSSVETAGLGDAGHLTQFLGTDTIAGLCVVRDFYGLKAYGPDKSVAGYSIPASEHSTMTSWGRTNETKALENMLDQYSKGLVGVVSDSYNIWAAVRNKYGGALKAKIMARDGVLVVRPDSGPPALVDLELLEELGKAFGKTKNSKGYWILPKQVRMIQGDGIDYFMLIQICETLKRAKWSIGNLAFGSGGGLLQKMNRDTQKVAFKCSLAVVNGKEIQVYKQPVHSPFKMSKHGRMTVNMDPKTGEYTTKLGADCDSKTDILETVFENGKLMKEYDWAGIKKRSMITAAETMSKYSAGIDKKADEILKAYEGSEQMKKDKASLELAHNLDKNWDEETNSSPDAAKILAAYKAAMKK